MNINKNLEQRFLKIPRETWRCELESGKINWEEHSVLFWLWLNANPMTGKAPLNYKILAEQMRERFLHIRKTNVINKLTKILNSLKRQQRLWFKRHSGSRGRAEVELHQYPLIQGGYTDISKHFQQNSSRALNKNHSSLAEVLKPQQNCEQNSQQLDSRTYLPKNSIPKNSPSRSFSRTHKIDRNKTDRQTDTSDVLNKLKNFGMDTSKAQEILQKYPADKVENWVNAISTKDNISNKIGYLLKALASGWSLPQTVKEIEVFKDTKAFYEAANKKHEEKYAQIRERLPEEQESVNNALSEMRANLTKKGLFDTPPTR